MSETVGKLIDGLLADLVDPEMYGFAIPDEVRVRVRDIRRLMRQDDYVHFVENTGEAFSVSQLLAIDAMLRERDHQDQKHGPISTHGHTLGEWIIIAEAELAEAKVALIKGGSGRNSLRSEIVQTAATLLACLEQHGVDDPHAGRQI